MAKINLEGMGEAGIRCDVAGSGSICDILLAGSGVPACAAQDVSSDYILIHANTAVCLVAFTTMATVVDGLQYPGDIL